MTKLEDYVACTKRYLDMCEQHDSFDSWRKKFNPSPQYSSYHNHYFWESGYLPNIIFNNLNFSCSSSEEDAMKSLENSLIKLGIIKKVLSEQEKLDLAEKWMLDNNKEAFFNGCKQCWVWRQNDCYNSSCDLPKNIYLNLECDKYTTKKLAILGLADALIKSQVRK